MAWRLERDHEEGDTMKMRDRNAKLDAETWSLCVKSVQKGGKRLVVGMDESLFIVHPCWVRVPGPAQQSAASVSVCLSGRLSALAPSTEIRTCLRFTPQGVKPGKSVCLSSTCVKMVKFPAAGSLDTENTEDAPA